MKKINKNQVSLMAASLIGIMSASAEPTGLLFGKLSGESVMDRAWSAATLYKDDDNQVLQEFALSGRLHLQSIYGESGGQSFNTSEYKDAGNNETVWGNDLEARRARLGFKSKWFQSWKFDGTFNVDVDGTDNANNDTYYKDLYELFVTYAPSDALNVAFGKTKVKFTREQETSSNNIITLERSLLSNTLFPGELTGAWVMGKGIAEFWSYELGVYGADRVREFSSFSNGVVVLGKVGYDYSSQSSLDSALASVHLMHNSEPGYVEPKSDEYTPSTSPNFENSIALTNEISHGRFGLVSDIMYGQGGGTQTNVMGISVTPSYFIAEGLQVVGRLQVASSSDIDGLRVSSRYERLPKDDKEKGDSYASAYLGLNYYLYGHKLKLMNGIEFSKMNGTGDYSGYTVMSGLRFSF